MAGKSQTVYLDRTLELTVERWALAHRLTKVDKIMGAEVKGADIPAAIVAILREFLHLPKEEKEGP